MDISGTRHGLWTKKTKPSKDVCLLPTMGFPTYNMLPPYLDFQIGVSIETLVKGVAKPDAIEALYISPSKRTALSKNKKVFATLTGDFMNYQSFPQLNDRYLSIPLMDSGLFDADLRHWLALPKSLYAVDGLTCNKIGVSYTPYRDQPNRCFATPSSCLRSQIADYQIARE